MEHPQKPTLELIRQYGQVFDIANRKTERELGELFRVYPKNSHLEHVLLKVTTLDKLYNTGIKRFGREEAIQVVAKHIVELDIDSRLSQGAPELVEEIARTPYKRVYSFASKYCAWHMPASYPIVDGLVVRLLSEYQKLERFHEFRLDDFGLDYRKYKAAIELFRQKYDLMSIGFKELDKFLWGYSKDYFGSK